MSNVSLELLRLFCIVAQTGKIYKAAESLYISQPAVTQSIKKLEEELGGALFYRTPKGVVLTEQGKSLYSFIKPSIDALENAPTHMNPACPRLSSPRIPTTRFRDTARMIYMHSGTISPSRWLEILPVLISSCITTKATITIP